MNWSSCVLYAAALPLIPPIIEPRCHNHILTSTVIGPSQDTQDVVEGTICQNPLLSSPVALADTATVPDYLS